MQLDEVKTESARLSPWAHIATVGADGRPDVVPVHPAWVDDTLWFLSDGKSVKVRNIAANPDVAMHWQVGESGDGIEMWGRATVHTDVETKRVSGRVCSTTTSTPSPPVDPRPPASVSSPSSPIGSCSSRTTARPAATRGAEPDAGRHPLTPGANS